MWEAVDVLVATTPTPIPRMPNNAVQDEVAGGKPHKHKGHHKHHPHPVKTLPLPGEGADAVLEAAQQALKSLGSPDEPIMLMDLGQAVRRLQLWKTHMPRVRPHYAVKCNPDRRLLQTLMDGGCGFDCATMEEIEKVLALGVPSNDVAFSHPCKLRSHLEFAKAKGVALMTFDNAVELKKVAGVHHDAQLLLRLACQDSSAQCPMSLKFGAPKQVWLELLDLAKELGLRVAGVHFHVGSGCKDPDSFGRALHDALEVFRLASERGMEPNVLDIGGGFPGVEQSQGGLHFSDLASCISQQLEIYFPAASFPNLRIMGEPGRFFAASVGSLLTKVFAKAEVPSAEDAQTEGPAERYYLNDGLYGAFNCVIYDHAEVVPEIMKLGDEPAPARPLRKCCLFGPTCDGFDKILENYEMPELFEGDWILWRNMGAYTSAAGSKFNGFPLARVWYYRHQLEGPSPTSPSKAK